jgi:hypothetical protein
MFAHDQTSEESMSKGEEFSELVNKNVYHHHLGTIRYDAKKMI